MSINYVCMMKPKLLKISVAPEQSFGCRRDVVPYFFSEWHFHPEVEIVYIEKGSGTRFVGNSIDHFQDGDMVMVGSELPHLWKCDPEYFDKNSTLRACSLVIHFPHNLYGEAFWKAPEQKKLTDLIEKSKLGLKITGKAKQDVVDLMKHLLNAQGIERTLGFIRILQIIAQSENLEWIGTTPFSALPSLKEGERMNEVFQFLLANFQKPITLDEISDVAKISPNAFCRYFKSRTQKTFTRFLLEMRINHACTLLSTTGKSVNAIMAECGFNNSSHFNKAFREVIGKTPLSYKKEHC